VKEAYIVKFNYQKPDGFFAIEKETVLVETSGSEKGNHGKAAEQVRSEHPGCEIISVAYV